jgi:hypothetical protein
VFAGKRLAESRNENVAPTVPRQRKNATVPSTTIDEDREGTSPSGESTLESSNSGTLVESPTYSSQFTAKSRDGPDLGYCHTQMRSSSVFAALFTNGLILGLRCGIQIPILSPPCTAKVPPSLRPTKLQMTVLHIPWIDRFPFPKMRDNVIRLSCDGFDEDELFSDIFIRDSFIITPGSLSWDAAGWTMVKSFQIKWGHLFL